MTRMSALPVSASAPTWLVLLLLLCVLIPQPLAAREGLWPGDGKNKWGYSWPAFIPGHELDYFNDVEWDFMNPNHGCPYFFHKNGTITQRYWRFCGSKSRYRVIEITEYYVVLLVDRIDKRFLKAKAKHPNLLWGTKIWMLHRAGTGSAHLVGCQMILDQHDPAHTNRPEFIGPEGFSMSQEELLARWNKNTRCNPKLMLPEREYFWGDGGEDLIYAVNPERTNPLWAVASGNAGE